ncbi:YdcF family protein [Jeotgalicoccus marinus]|uniref:YdcF family protein n=1 Tax=Jeotgalicoccus marinus TaxID=516700 RepID=UPI00041510B9|nr:YdcF family protein [Jeotgalicoccus marinus]
MKIKGVIIILGICLIMILVVFTESLNHSKTDTPKQADVIIMLGGGDKGRMQKAAELYHDNYADYVIISPVRKHIYPQTIEFATELGIPESAIIEEHDATSTYTNATETLKLMDEYEFDSALVVTSDYHLKRSKMIYDRVNNNKFDLSYISAPNTDGKEWHERGNTMSLWFSEFYKLWGYRLGLYNFIDQSDHDEQNPNIQK